MFLADDVVGCQILEGGLGVSTVHGVVGRGQGRLGEVFESEFVGLLHELVEVDGVVLAGEFIVEGDLWGAFADALQLIFEDAAIGIVGGPFVGDELEKSERVGDALNGVGVFVRLELEDVAGEGAEMAAGQCVVADEGDSVGSEQLLAEGEQMQADREWDPGVEAVSEDVVELADAGTDIEDVALKDADIGEAEILDALLGALDGQGGEVEADKFTVGQSAGHGDEVCAFIAGDLKDAAVVDGRRREAVESGDDGEVVGMRVGVGMAGVSDCIVEVERGGHGGSLG